MNKINPFYVLIFSVLLFLYSIINLNSVSSKFVLKKETTKKYILLAERYNNLQKTWGKENKTIKLINKIIKSTHIQNANINKLNKIVKIRIKDTTIEVLDKFFNKILNEHLIINKFTLTKSELTMEIGI